MHELDLIPEDYRRVFATRRILQLFGVFYLVLLLSLLAGKIFLNKNVADVTDKIALLEEQQQIVSQQEEQMLTLLQSRVGKEKQLQFINMLERGGGVDQIFLVFDRVLDKSVWFSQWQYQAAGLIKESAGQHESVNAQPMRIKITGQATDNTALSVFVMQLIAQPEIEDVTVHNTTMIGRDSAVISFEMDVL